MYQQGNTHRLNELVPSYVPHSDYLPGNRIVDLSSQAQVQPWIQTYEIQKSKNQCSEQRPVNFNPSRYISVRTFENVKVGQPISEADFARMRH